MPNDKNTPTPADVDDAEAHQRSVKETEEKGEQVGKRNGSPIPLPDEKAEEASERRIPGEAPIAYDPGT